MTEYLVANRGHATWLLAAPSANLAGPIQLATGLPVMAMGGFSGSDPAPALEELKGYVRSGELRFVMTAGARAALPGPGGARGSSDTSGAIANWVTEACTLVQVDQESGSGSASPLATGVYDCAGAAG